MTLVEIAKLPKVHEWLRLAMVAYEKAQTNPGAFAEHGDLKTLGLSGGCYEVSRVFSFLLNDIKGKGRTSIHTTGGQHADTTHTSVKAITFPPQYIDATWRQGNAQNFDGLDEDPRKNLEMVRITDEPPTMASINRAVREALGT